MSCPGASGTSRSSGRCRPARSPKRRRRTDRLAVAGRYVLLEDPQELGHDRVAFERHLEAPVHVDGRLGLLERAGQRDPDVGVLRFPRSEEHTSELQSQSNLVCRLLLEKKKKQISTIISLPVSIAVVIAHT